MSAVVETKNLTKRYREKLAVNSLSLTVQQGEVFGFLGPNGAGKTTTILMLLGLTEPTSGEVSVCGFKPTVESLEVKKRVGYLPENPGFYDDLSARENLLYMARLNRIPEDEAHRRTAEVLDQVGLPDDARRLVKEFSRGMNSAWALPRSWLKSPPRLFSTNRPSASIPTARFAFLVDSRSQSRSRFDGHAVIACTTTSSTDLQSSWHYRQGPVDRSGCNGCSRQSHSEGA